jgi:two-component system chemotaxis family response regulator WspR
MRTLQEILDDPAAAGPMRKPPMHVLVIEDDALQRRLIQKCLEVPGREPVQVTFAGSIAEARTAITETRYDCIVIDHQLPDGRGCDLIEEVEDQLLTAPVLGISAHANAEIAVEYFRSGCADFLYKDEALQADTLRRRIAGAMSRFQRRAMSTIIERQQLGEAIVQSQERLISLARIDHLTGICNRAVFDDLHPVFHRDAEQQRDPYTVCMIDVDRFKAYNDLYGHAGGDDALRRVAQTLAASIRAEDFVARYGGEELVVLLHKADGEEARPVAERLRQAVYEASIPHERNADLGRVTVSIGVAPFDPDQPAPPKRLRLLADEALYQAKEAGRNRVVVVPASPHLELSPVPGRSA